MRRLAHLRTTVLVLLAVFVLFPQRAYGYVDPGTGSYILQIIIAGLLGGLFALKMSWKSIRLHLTNLFSKRNDDAEPDE